MVSSKWRFAPRLLFWVWWHHIACHVCHPRLPPHWHAKCSWSTFFISSFSLYSFSILHDFFENCFCTIMFLQMSVRCCLSKAKEIRHKYSPLSQKFSWLQLPKYNGGWFTRQLVEPVFFFFSWLLASSHAAVVAKGLLAILPQLLVF